MKVLCETKHVKILGNHYKNWGFPHIDYQLNIVEGEIYVVYAIQLKDGYLRYLIDIKSSMSGYSSAHLVPSPLFSIVDHRVSKYWRFNTTLYNNSAESIWGYAELTEISVKGNFQGLFDLIDGESSARDIFLNYKPQFDLEFPDERFPPAKEIDDHWIMCPVCEFVWESISPLGLLICSSCKNVVNNPKYATLYD